MTGEAQDSPAAAASRRAVHRLPGLLQELRAQSRDLAVHLVTHWRLIVGMLAAAGAGGLLFAWSGLYSVAASSGHYPLFRQFLSYALEQSVGTHSAGIVVPALDDPALIRRGAGHYQGGCTACHGAPGQAPDPISRRMLPEPPYLGDVLQRWTPQELFWIVKHGIKYTGMPAWVALRRDDEVWAVVAFLRHLPSLDVAGYRRLAFGAAAGAPAEALEQVEPLLVNGPPGGGVAACARCHGMDGQGDAVGAFPRLAGQTTEYLQEALRVYALGARPSGIMQPVAAALNQAEMRRLAAHYASQPVAAAAPAEPAPAATLALGRRIAQEGLPEQRIAPCAACHGPKAGGVPALYPRLEGQFATYIADQLALWNAGIRGGRTETPLAQLMARALGRDPDRPEGAGRLTSAQIGAVAAWYASRPPASGSDRVEAAR